MAEQAFQVGVKGLIRNGDGQILMVHLPGRHDKPAFWDLPGGRMDSGESFLETLAREMQEEIGVSYAGSPRHLSTLLTSITIPVGDIRMPLILVIYETKLPEGATITLDPESGQDQYAWFEPAAAADELETKFAEEFCELLRSLT